MWYWYFTHNNSFDHLDSLFDLAVARKFHCSKAYHRYPLVMTHITHGKITRLKLWKTMENSLYSILYMVIFHSYVSHYQRVSSTYDHVNLACSSICHSSVKYPQKKNIPIRYEYIPMAVRISKSNKIQSKPIAVSLPAFMATNQAIQNL